MSKDNGNCNAVCFIGDDFGDNSATIRCEREPGHIGKHREVWSRNGGEIIIEWDLDETELVACFDCGAEWEGEGFPTIGTRCGCGSELFHYILKRDRK